MEIKEQKMIDYRFNMALIAIYVLGNMFMGVLDYNEQSSTLFDSLFQNNLLLAITISFTLVVIGAIIAIWIVKNFWTRFVAPVFNVREITSQESLSIGLVLAIFLS